MRKKLRSVFVSCSRQVLTKLVFLIFLRRTQFKIVLISVPKADLELFLKFGRIQSYIFFIKISYKLIMVYYKSLNLIGSLTVVYSTIIPRSGK